ncbi:LysR family transcriptional regulator [Hyalangium versicolor]|uniref:LysR family transcriptional regulator n=1 Tax=Hyalangium versicolor TaxID=2861190 RepID=UPI001CCAF281|nr:LysR family transcriptional regulator [Hyalangium versicolor]
MDRYAAMRVFVKVAELRSFTQAAVQLGLPRATATTTVQELEALVQAKLLNRTTRKVELTPDGLSFFERCKDVLSDIEEMESMFQTRSAAIRGKIRIDMASSLARDVVIPQLPKFFEMYPEVEVEIIGVDRRVDLIREGVDCTIRGGPLEPGLSAVELDWGEVTIVNAASPAYLKKYGRPKDLDDLKNHRLVHYSTVMGELPDGFEYFDGERSRQIKMKSVITVATIDAYKAAALAGLGICQNPRIGIREYLKSGQLVEVLPKFRPAPGRNAKIVYPQRRFLAKRVRAFIEWVTPILRVYFESQDA